MKLTKEAAIKEATRILDEFPDHIKCVQCERTWVAEQDDEDEGDWAVRIRLSDFTYKGWCNFGGEQEPGRKRGNHCPSCYRDRKNS